MSDSPKSSEKMTFHYDEQSKERLDKYLSRHLQDYSRATISSMIKSGCVSLNENIITLGKKALQQGDTITFLAPKELEARSSHITPEEHCLAVAFESDDFLIIDKPAGLVVHPGAGISSGTLVHALAHSHPKTTLLPNWGLIHRLDKDTSGLLIVAKNEISYYHLNQMMQQREISRRYQALVRGNLRYSRTVETKMARCPHNRLKRAVTQSLSAKNAITHIKILEQLNQATHIECQLETGRTHQIRVHCEHIGHPIVGDRLYRGRFQLQSIIDRQALHAYDLRFVCPITQKNIHVMSPLAPDFKNALQLLQNEGKA